MPNKLVTSKKPPAAGRGRPKGVPNKATADVRAAIAMLAESKVGQLAQWLDDTANGDPANGVKPDPGKAAMLLLSAIEYHIPKLARTEQVGDEDQPIRHLISWQD